jgi:hypothetical protein
LILNTQLQHKLHFAQLVKAQPLKLQQGAAAVEFAFVVILFFALLLGIIEFGRFMYVWNTVQEVSRIAAREAVVSNFTNAEQDRIRRMAVFSVASSGTPSLPGAAEINASHVNIEYLNDIGVPVSALPADPAGNVEECLDNSNRCIRYVQASVCQQGNGNQACRQVRYEPMVGLFNFLDIEIPASTVIMPAESLGYAP